MEEVAENEQDVDGGKRKEKEEADKHKAENMRPIAMEKLGETQKRAAEEGEGDIGKKRRRNGNETIEFLPEKSESEKAFMEEELVLKRKQQEIEGKKLTAFLDQQKSMIQLMQEQQQQQQVQNNNIQMMMMGLLDRIANKLS